MVDAQFEKQSLGEADAVGHLRCEDDEHVAGHRRVFKLGVDVERVGDVDAAEDAHACCSRVSRMPRPSLLRVCCTKKRGGGKADPATLTHIDSTRCNVSWCYESREGGEWKEGGEGGTCSWET